MDKTRDWAAKINGVSRKLPANKIAFLLMAIPTALDVSSYRIIPLSNDSFDIVLRFADGQKLGQLTYKTNEVDPSSIPRKIIGIWQDKVIGEFHQFVCIDPKFKKKII